MDDTLGRDDAPTTPVTAGAGSGGSEPDLSSKAATAHTAGANRAAAALAYLDPSVTGADQERATRGRIGQPTTPNIAHDGGWDVWDQRDYDFLADDCPPEVHPGLWRQARLNREAGLFEVAPGFHQVRGLDLANLTVVEGEQGRIVIDPLTSVQTARAAMALVDEHLGARAVTAVIYTHSHVDHFGGVRGVIDETDVRSGAVRVIAPLGFLEAAISENILAGTAMTRRATYMYGGLLPKSARGHVDAGLGKGVPLLADQGLVAPTEEVAETGTELVVDGVRIHFQVTPDTEAPSEMNFHFPDHRVLCMAENCTCALHNLYTPRGAQVRDALSWSTYLHEAIDLYGSATDVCFASHHWPRWGSEEIVAHLAKQRDVYRFLHDQTLRLANKGQTSIEIAEEIRLPPALEADPSSRGYYGTVNHNAKAVYQRYLGWFDANPAHLHPLPPVEAGRRYVEFMGGADAVIAKAKTSFDDGDYRWVVEVVNHLVFSEPENAVARALQADALEQLGYQAESAPWRDFYLTGAQELRRGHPGGDSRTPVGPETVTAMSTEMVFQYLGTRIDGVRAAERTWAIDVTVTDRDERWYVGIEHGAIHTRRLGGEEGAARGVAPVVIEATHVALAALVFDGDLGEVEAGGNLVVSGERDALVALLDSLDTFGLWFPIVTP
ncbi:MAG: alkyl/aryl-sulfatase [Acidimicrobiales bacterium]